MYKKSIAPKTSIKINTSYTGETIEQKIQRIVNNKEPISDGAPLIFTERKDGVQPDHNVRTDKWEAAIDAMDIITKTDIAKRQERIGKKAKENMDKEAKTDTIKPETGANTSD